MRIPRIYHPSSLQGQATVSLCDDAVNHVSRVLRMNKGETIELFDGSNHTYQAIIDHIDKKHVELVIKQQQLNDRESPINLHLGQVISRGERMEFTIQKSVELGVNTITPLFSERCGVKLEAERLDKKIQQWRKMVIAACEQCGRNQLPYIADAMELSEWCPQGENDLKLNLHPRAQYSINTLVDKPSHIRLLIGPEGGLSAQEIEMTTQHGFTDILLGPRVLRTETAALAAITALQIRFGDLG